MIGCEKLMRPGPSRTRPPRLRIGQARDVGADGRARGRHSRHIIPVVRCQDKQRTASRVLEVIDRDANASWRRPAGAIGNSMLVTPRRWSCVSDAASSTSARGLPAAASYTSAATDGARSGKAWSSSSSESPRSSGPSSNSGKRARSSHAPHGSRAASATRKAPAGPACNEQDALARGRVEPMEIVDDDQHRRSGRRCAEHRKRRDAHRQPIARGRGSERKGSSERGRLRRRQCAPVVEDRRQKVGKPHEWELGLGLDARGSQHGHAATPHRSIRRSSSTVLPIPATPRISNPDRHRSPGAPRNSSTLSSSVNRPTTIESNLQRGRVGRTPDHDYASLSPPASFFVT